MAQEVSGNKISPLIQDNKVISLKIDGKSIPLRSPIEVSEFFGKILEPLSILTKYIDLTPLFSSEGKVEPWKKDTLEEFLQSLSDIQVALVKLVFHCGRLKREKLIAELRKKSFDLDSKKLAGIVAGMNRRIAQSNKKNLLFIVSGDYIINDEYYELFREVFHMENMKRKKDHMITNYPGTGNQFAIARFLTQDYDVI